MTLSSYVNFRLEGGTAGPLLTWCPASNRLAVQCQIERTDRLRISTLSPAEPEVVLLVTYPILYIQEAPRRSFLLRLVRITETGLTSFQAPVEKLLWAACSKTRASSVKYRKTLIFLQTSTASDIPTRSQKAVSELLLSLEWSQPAARRLLLIATNSGAIYCLSWRSSRLAPRQPVTLEHSHCQKVFQSSLPPGRSSCTRRQIQATRHLSPELSGVAKLPKCVVSQQQSFLTRQTQLAKGNYSSEPWALPHVWQAHWLAFASQALALQVLLKTLCYRQSACGGFEPLHSGNGRQHPAGWRVSKASPLVFSHRIIKIRIGCGQAYHVSLQFSMTAASRLSISSLCILRL